MRDIKISDEEFFEEAKRAYQEADRAEEVLQGIHDIISQIDNEYIKGEVRENFSRFVSMIESMQGQLTLLIEEEAELICKFITEIDEADQFLY